MSSTSLDILIRARDMASRTLQSVGRSASQVGAGFTKAGVGITNVGSALTRTVTPAALGAAVALHKMGQDFDGAVRRAATNGKDFTATMDSIKNLAGQVPQSLTQISEAIDAVGDRTGQTGPELEELTKKFLDLERITGEAASSTIPQVTRLFGDWSISTEKQSETMDKLFRASEATGVSISELADNMVSFGSPLRQLGFDMETTAAMFAAFEQEGVNIQTAMPGLRMALKNFAADGREPAKALQQVIDKIKEAATTAEANTLAFKVFGTRAGPDLAAAIREGRFNLEDLIGTINNGSGTLEKATKRAETFSDRLAMMRNKITAILGPFGEFGAVLAGAVASLGPFLMGLGQLIPLFGKLGKPLGKVVGFLRLLGGPGGVGIAAAIAIGGIAYETMKADERIDAMVKSLRTGSTTVEAMTTHVDDMRGSLTAADPVFDDFATRMAAMRGSGAPREIDETTEAIDRFTREILGAVRPMVRLGGANDEMALAIAQSAGATKKQKVAFSQTFRVAGQLTGGLTEAEKKIVKMYLSTGHLSSAQSFLNRIIRQSQGPLRNLQNGAENAAEAEADLGQKTQAANAALRGTGPAARSGLAGLRNWMSSAQVAAEAAADLGQRVAYANSQLASTPGGNGGNGGGTVPRFAEGGIVRGPTLAMIGEAGPEAVVPLRKMGSMGGGGRVDVRIDRRRFVRAQNYQISYGGS